MSTAEHETRSPIPPGYTPEEWEEILAERARIHAEVAALPKFPLPKRGTDARGQILPISDEEWKERVQSFKALIEEFKAMPDTDPPGAHEAAMRGIDEERRRLGMRTLFDGIY